MKTWFLIFILCISISKLVLSSIMFKHARNVRSEHDSEKRLQEIEEILDGSPRAVANQVLGTILVILLVGGILMNLKKLKLNLKN